MNISVRWQAHKRRKTNRNTFKGDINTKLKLACNSVHRIQIWKIAKNGHFGVLVRPLPMTRLSWNYTHFFPRPPRVCVQNLKSVGCIVFCPWTLKNQIIQKNETYICIHVIWQNGFPYISGSTKLTEKVDIFPESAFHGTWGRAIFMSVICSF